MKIATPKKHWPVLLALGAAALAPWPAAALDTNNFTTATDASCWLSPACSIPRGGNSDVMRVYAPGPVLGVRGPVFEQIFAFGAEEANNAYFFDISRVQGDPAQASGYTTLFESDGSAWSDVFGVRVSAQGTAFVGFLSDPQAAANIPPATFIVFEQPGIPNPVPEPNNADSAYLTVEYDATKYLSPAMQNQGFTATFQSVTAVPEPETYAMLLAGLGLLSLVARRKTR